MTNDELKYGTLLGWSPRQPVINIAPNDPLIEDSDYVGTLTKTSAQVSCVRPISFSSYENANPGWRRRWRLPAVSEVIIHLDVTMTLSNFNGGAAIIADGSLYSEFTIPNTVGRHYYRVGFATAAKRNIELVMPYNAAVAHAGLTVHGQIFAPSDSRSTALRAVIIGDSRGAGLSATGIAKTWGHLLCVAKGWQHINLGLPSSPVTAAWGTILGNADPDVVVCLTDYPDCLAQTALATFKQRYKDFITNFRAIKPTTKFYLIQSTWVAAASDAGVLKVADYRTQEADALTELGDANNILIDGLALTTVDDTTRFPDGVHPGNTGASEIASALESLVSI